MKPITTIREGERYQLDSGETALITSSWGRGRNRHFVITPVGGEPVALHIKDCLAKLNLGFARRLDDDERHCSQCGCTDVNCTQCMEATGQQCSWVDDEEWLCTRCAPYEEVSG